MRAIAFAVLVVSEMAAFGAPRPAAPLSGYPVARRSVVSAANGDWRQWRGNPQHTGFQSLPGRIVSPQVEWRYRLGGVISAEQVLVQGASPGVGARVFLAVGGRLQAYDSSGSVIFDRNLRLRLVLIGVWDFAGDGRRQILAATSEISANRLLLLSGESGDLLWESPETDGQIGSVKVLEGSGGCRVLWLPAASSRLFLLDFTGNSTAPQVVWEDEIKDFVSDPYSFSALGVSDLNHDGTSSVIVAGARGRVAVIVLDAATGKEKFRVAYPDVNGGESGGTRQLLHIGDLDGSGHDQILCVSSHGSDSQYMFQGATVTDPSDPGLQRDLDTAPVGLRYVPGSVTDLDGDGRSELLVSRYDVEAHRHDLLLLDASTLSLRATYRNFFLLAVQKRTDGLHDILGAVDVVSEEPFEGTLAGLRFESADTSFREVWRRSDAVDIGGSSMQGKGVGSSAVDNPGPSPILLCDDGVDQARAVFRRWRSNNGGVDLVSVRLHDGTTQSTFGPIVRFDFLGAVSGDSRQTTRVLLGTAGGDVVFLDGFFAIRSQIPVGGYWQNQALNGHSFEVAAVADLDGSGRREITVIDSQNRILRLLRETPDRSSEPATQVLASTSIPQELCVAPSPGGEGRLFVVGETSGGPKLSLIDGSGRTVWTHLFGGAPGDPIEDAIPIGLNVGHFGPGGNLGVVFTSGSSMDLPRSTYALDVATGAPLWRSSGAGGYWDANAVVTDVDGDGRDDVLINANIWKAFVVSGANGEEIGGPVILPAYGALGLVDYNGAPIVVRRSADGVRVLIAQDDAHLSLVSVGGACDTPAPCPARVVWASPQTSVDSERRSMAALAPLSDGSVLVGVGSTTGKLRAVRERDGTERWHETLEGGRVTLDATVRSNPLSSVLAMDVNADGRVDFVVGGADGWLYALDAETGRLLWSLDLGAPVGDPIAADFDNLGSSKILVPTADGYLYAVGPGATEPAGTR